MTTVGVVTGAARGTLRAVAHAAGISPTMAGWRRILTVNPVGTALLARALRPLATAGTAMACFASMAPLLGSPDPAAAAIVDDPLAEGFLDRVRDALGPAIEDTGVAYMWAKLGVQRFVRQEAARLGPAGARVCSVSPGIISTPQSDQEAASHPSMDRLVRQTPGVFPGSSGPAAWPRPWRDVSRSAVPRPARIPRRRPGPSGDRPWPSGRG